MLTNNKIERFTALILYWCSVLLVIAAFVIKSEWAIFLFIFIIPIFYGTHEAIHDHLVPGRKESFVRAIHNEFALLIGCALQMMNYKLIRQAHFSHHNQGRNESGYSPDIFLDKLTLKDYLVYYSYLLFLPALENQAAGLLLIFTKPRKLGFSYGLEIRQGKKSKLPFILVQLFCVFILVLFIYLGGINRVLLFEAFFVILWSILQNPAHYGLKGTDERTDRVCAHTYILEKPFKIITFGTTSHLAHHVNAGIPCLDLYDKTQLEKIENKIGDRINIKYGVISFIRDILVQFRGPLTPDKLNSDWLINKDKTHGQEMKIEAVYRKGIKRQKT
jgi:fatty acid desaturase